MAPRPPPTVDIDGEKLGRLLAEVDQLKRDVAALKTDMDELIEMAHRWRGAFALVLGLGSLVGWIISLIPKFR